MATTDTPKPEKRTTVKMKYVGHFRGLEKIVHLPIPLISNSQKLDQVLSFQRKDTKQGPAFCEVPLEWVGALLLVGGNWQLDEKMTPELQAQIGDAKAACDLRMAAFVRDNELVDA